MNVNQDYEIRNTPTDRYNWRYESYWMTKEEIELSTNCLQLDKCHNNVVDI